MKMPGRIKWPSGFRGMLWGAMAVAAMGLGWGLGCTSDDDPPLAGGDGIYDLHIVSGNNQSGMVGKALDEPLVVKAMDHRDQPLRDITVTFVVQSGGGGLFHDTQAPADTVVQVTNQQGLAQVNLRLGPRAGTNLVAARVIGLSGLAPTFTAIGAGEPLDDIDAPDAPPRYAHADHFSVTAEPVNLAGGVRSGLQAQIKAYVFDAANNPVDTGTVVRFRTSGGGIQPTATTDASGRAEATLTTAAPVPEDGWVTVTAEARGADGALVTTQTQLLFSGATQVSVQEPAATPFAVTPGQDQALRFTVQDANGHPLAAGTVIEVTVTGGSLTGPARFEMEDTRDPEATQFATQFQGEVGAQRTHLTIAVTSPNGNREVRLTGVAPEPASLVLTAADSELVFDGSSTTTVRVVVQDEEGQGVAGQRVEFSATAGSIAATAVTDAVGEARVTYRVPAAAAEVPVVTITARCQALTAQTQLRAFVAPQRHAHADHFSVTAAPVNLAGGVRFGLESSITAYVFDAAANPVDTGTAVRFSTNGGGIRQTALTDASGRATTTLTTAAPVPADGWVTVTAAAPGAEGEPVEAQARVLFSGATQVTVQEPAATPFAVTPEQDQALRFTVADANGNPLVAGTVIQVAVSGGRLTGPARFTMEDTQEAAATQFATQFRGEAGAERTQLTITVTSPNGNREVRLTGVAPEPEPEPEPVALVVTVSDDELVFDGTSTTRVRVVVRDEAGKGLSGQTVEFAATAGSIPATAVTDAAGEVTVTYRSPAASEDVSTVTITARCQALTGQTQVQAYVAPAPPEPATLVVTVADDELVFDGTSTTRVRVVVRDEGGQGLSGQTVEFAATAGSIPASAVTDAAGEATVTYRSPAASEDVSVVTITARCDELTGQTQVQAYVAPAPPEPVSLVVTVSDEELVFDGTSTTRVRVVVRDEGGKGLSGKTVEFAATAGSIPASAVTDAAGEATVTYRSPAASEAVSEVTITARCEELTGQTQVQAYEAPAVPEPATLVVTVSDDELVFDGTSTTRVRVVVRDEGGKGLSGQTVEFAATAGSIPASAVTDAAGEATVTYRSPAASEDVSVVTITARCEELTGQTQVQAYVAPPVRYAHADHFSVTAAPVNLAGGVSSGLESRITAYVFDITNNPVDTGTEVRFSTTGGGVRQTALTDAAGRATATLTTAAPVPANGWVTVSAAAPGADGEPVTAATRVLFSGATEVVVQEPATSFEVTPDRDQALRFTVADANGHPLVAGTVIQVAVSGGRLTGPARFEMEDTQEAAATQFATQFRGDAGAERTQVTIAVTSPNGNREVVLTGRPPAPPEPATLAIVANDSVLVADGTSSTTLYAEVFDGDGNRLPGQTVTFATTAGTIPATAVTDAAGQAEVTYVSAVRAEGVPEVTVTAQAGEVSAATTLRLLGVQLRLAAAVEQLAADGLDQTTLTAVLETYDPLGDHGGDPVPFVPVRFSAPVGTLSAATEPTSIMGEASVRYRGVPSREDPGDVRVRARAAGVEAFVDIRLLGVHLTMSTQRDTIVADGNAQSALYLRLQRSDGVPLTDAPIHLQTTLGSLSAPVVETDAFGDARAILVSGTTTGRAVVTATYGDGDGLQAVASVAMIKGPPASIALVSVDPASIGVRGAGANETAIVTFEVRDAWGNTVADGETIYFALKEGLQYSATGRVGPDSTATVNGRVTAAVTSDTLAGTVQLIAWASSRDAGAGTIHSEPVPIAIHGGHPYQDRFSVAPRPVNLAGRVVYGLESTVTAYVFDRYSNPVPAGTAVHFRTKAGGIQGSAVTNADGQAAVTLFTAGPEPTAGDNWLAKITAYTQDEKGDQIKTETDVLFSGQTERIAFHRRRLIGGQIVETPVTEVLIEDGSRETVYFRVQDDQGNPIMGGSTIRATSDVASVSGDINVVMPDVRSGHTLYSITITDPNPTSELEREEGVVDVRVTSINGNQLGSLATVIVRNQD